MFSKPAMHPLRAMGFQVRPHTLTQLLGNWGDFGQSVNQRGEIKAGAPDKQGNLVARDNVFENRRNVA